MLTISYGMFKTGSTLAFELAKAILEENGHGQRKLPEVTAPGHAINFLTEVTPETVDDLLRRVPEDRHVVFKTHAGIDLETATYLGQMVAARKMNVHLVCRDPREICLSLIDHGERSRREGAKAFSKIFTFEDSLRVLRRQVQKNMTWSLVSGVTVLRYDDIAFAPDGVIDLFEAQFGVTCAREKVKDDVFTRRFTQKNRAVQRRYLTDMSEVDQRIVLGKFGAYMDFFSGGQVFGRVATGAPRGRGVHV